MTEDELIAVTERRMIDPILHTGTGAEEMMRLYETQVISRAAILEFFGIEDMKHE